MTETVIRIDGEGNLYFCDGAHNVVRKVDTRSGIITTVLGCGEEGFSPDGTPALKARLGQPGGMEVSEDGTRIYISDTASFKIRTLDTDGTLKTVAGTDGGADSGDDILLISDHWNNRVNAVKLGRSMRVDSRPVRMDACYALPWEATR